MPYDPITLLSTLSTIALPPDTQDSLSVSWLDSYRMGFPPMKHYTLCWAHTDRLSRYGSAPYGYFIRKCRTLQDGFPAFFFFRLQSRQNRGKLRHHGSILVICQELFEKDFDMLLPFTAILISDV